jgi:hypothetical protein
MASSCLTIASTTPDTEEGCCFGDGRLHSELIEKQLPGPGIGESARLTILRQIVEAMPVESLCGYSLSLLACLKCRGRAAGRARQRTPQRGSRAGPASQLRAVLTHAALLRAARQVPDGLTSDEQRRQASARGRRLLAWLGGALSEPRSADWLVFGLPGLLLKAAAARQQVQPSGPQPTMETIKTNLHARLLRLW